MELFEDSEARKTFEGVFTEETLEALYHLADDGHFDVLHGFVKEGKESKVAVATKGEERIAVKLYTIEASRYRDMQKYLLGDPRFRGIKRNRRSIVFNWCKKEFKNLTKAQHLGLDAPRPIAFEKNVLLLEFLGEGFTPAPRLVDVELENPGAALDILLDSIRRMWREEEMVHGDLSAYNVLVWKNRPYLIDFSQAVLEQHPRSREFLQRDVENVMQHFAKRYGLDRDPHGFVESLVAD